MPRIELVDPSNTSGDRKTTLTQINDAFGATPNMFKAIANSPAALKMMWAAFGALSQGKLGAALGEQVAVAIANANRCEYCLAAHTVLGVKAGVSKDAMAAAQKGHSSDPKTQAALDFALKVVKERANIAPTDVTALRSAGFDDEAIAELLAHVALNIFTNYTNVAFDVPVDFPKVALT